MFILRGRTRRSLAAGCSSRGRRWGGNWRGINDRPHIEYHPGLGAGEARAMLPGYRQGGLQQVWDNLGLGGR